MSEEMSPLEALKFDIVGRLKAIYNFEVQKLEKKAMEIAEEKGELLDLYQEILQLEAKIKEITLN